MRFVIVIVLLCGTGFTEDQTSKPVPLANNSFLSARGIATENVAEDLRLCCGGPTCIPGEPCGSGPLLLAAGSREPQPSDFFLLDNGLTFSRFVGTNDLEKRSFCCGGPVCIPHEPCGSGTGKVSQTS